MSELLVRNVTSFGPIYAPHHRATMNGDSCWFYTGCKNTHGPDTREWNLGFFQQWLIDGYENTIAVIIDERGTCHEIPIDNVKFCPEKPTIP